MNGPSKFCRDCGEKILERAVVCPKCGCAQSSPKISTHDSVAFLLVVLVVILFFGAMAIGYGYIRYGGLSRQASESPAFIASPSRA